MKVLDLKQTHIKTSMKRSSILFYAKTGKMGFPASVKISAMKIGFIEAEIDAWIQSRIDLGRTPSTTASDAKG